MNSESETGSVAGPLSGQSAPEASALSFPADATAAPSVTWWTTRSAKARSAAAANEDAGNELRVPTRPQGMGYQPTLADLTEDVLEWWQSQMLAQGYSTKDCRERLRKVRTFAAWCLFNRRKLGEATT